MIASLLSQPESKTLEFARVFRELELVEQWGSGIPGIFRQAAAAKLPEPLIEELAGRVRFTVFLPEIIPLSREQARGSIVEEPDPGAQSRAQSDRVLQMLTNTAYSAGDLAQKIGVESKSGAFKRSLKYLLQEKLIQYTIPDKPNSRLQKYRLTPKGRKWLDENR